MNLGALLKQSKAPSAEELHKLIMKGSVTYEEIRRVDTVRFQDLEATMRLLYDHKSQSGDTTQQWPLQGT